MFKQAAAETDLLALLIRVTENVILLHLACDMKGVPGAGPEHPTRRLLIALMHVAWRLLEPQVYMQYRWYFLTHFRLYNALSVLSIMKEVQRTAFRHGGGRHLEDIVLRRDLVGNLTTHSIRLLVVGTASMGMLIHSLPTSVPFLIELPLQLACLAFAILYWSSTPTSEFASPIYNPIADHSCTGIARWLSLPLPGSRSPRSLAALCTTHLRPWVVILWVIVFVGFVLPVYIAYCTERCLKARYLQDLAGSTPGGTTQPAGPTTAGSSSTTQPPATRATATAAPSPQLTVAHAWLYSITNSICLLAIPRPVRSVPSSCPGRFTRLLQLLRSACAHAFWLWMFGALSWHAVAAWHTHLVPHIRFRPPLGSNQQWYWQVLCGTPDPCCLAG